VIPSEVREQVRARIDLAELVTHYVPLRRAGTSLLARCPFHDEKSASFHVSRDKGVFYCFGCKASGDVFDFYQRIEGVSFPEAIRALAERAGIEVTEEARDPQKIAEERRAKELTERLFFACECACEFFEKSLLEAERSELAREAIAARGVSTECAQSFRLGYAPGEWSALAENLRARGVSPQDAELAGLLLPRTHGGGMYDRFRHRLMFPVFDRQSRVVAFSGRVLPVTEDMAEGIVPENAGKYINSPETPIYRKSDLLYGLQVARGAMVKSADAILVEGNFDVVTMH
jgi:DNA primase